MKTNYVKEAKAFIKRGVSILPLREDGGKRPKIEWLEYQNRFMTDAEIEEHCSRCGGLAAITGSISNLVCVDFDLSYQLPSQDFWGDFCKQVPKELRKKFRVNKTRSEGFHVWLRAKNFTFPSKKITHRLLTIPEMYEMYINKIEEKKGNVNFSINQYQTSLLNKPVKCVIETRFEGSYGVIMHDSYTHYYGDKLHEITYDEWVLLESIMYSLDCGFRPKPVYKGEVESYKVISKYNDETSAEEVADMLCQTGLYDYSRMSPDRSGNILLKRDGSSSSFSTKVFSDSGLIYDHGMSNIFTDGKQNHTPFELLCAINKWDEEEGVNYLNELYN